MKPETRIMLAGVLAAIGATLAGWLLATQVFDLEYAIDPWVWAIGLAAGAIVYFWPRRTPRVSARSETESGAPESTEAEAAGPSA